MKMTSKIKNDSIRFTTSGGHAIYIRNPPDWLEQGEDYDCYVRSKIDNEPFEWHRLDGPAIEGPTNYGDEPISRWWVDDTPYNIDSLEDTIKLMKAIKKYAKENDLYV